MRETGMPIRLAARLSGVEPHLIRIWEQRYQAVQPRRSRGKHRLYSQEDVERLSLMRQLTLSGHSIGQVAGLTTAQLRRLAASIQAAIRAPAASEEIPATDKSVDACLAAVRAMDERGLRKHLEEAGARIGTQGLLVRVVAPLLHALGRLWCDGTISAAHEHFAVTVVRDFLGDLAKPMGNLERAPLLVTATPSGQLHELGALLVSALAANLGWRTVRLGASVPVIELAGAVRELKARALALSVVYPEDDPDLPRELERLRALLPPEVALIVGGAAAPAYREVLERIQAYLVEELAQLPALLTDLRRSAAPSAARNKRQKPA